MNEALILEKLDQLSAEVQSLKSDVLQELKQDLEPVSNRPSPVWSIFCRISKTITAKRKSGSSGQECAEPAWTSSTTWWTPSKPASS